MTRISSYSVDKNIGGNDKWIGSDAQNSLMTKNFTPNNVASYFNDNNVIDIGTSVRYRYQTLDIGEPRAQGTISFETEIGPQVNFSSITTFLLAKNTLKQNNISSYLNFLTGSYVLLSKASNINIFGYYRITSIEAYVPDPNFFVVDVTFVNGNGFIYEDLDYLISLVDKQSGGGGIETVTGTLVDNTDPLNPIINKQDIDSVLNTGNTTSNGVVFFSESSGVEINTENAPQSIIFYDDSGVLSFMNKEAFYLSDTSRPLGDYLIEAQNGYISFLNAQISFVQNEIQLSNIPIKFTGSNVPNLVRLLNDNTSTGITDAKLRATANEEEFIAYLSDIEAYSPSLQQVTDVGNTTTNEIVCTSDNLSGVGLSPDGQIVINSSGEGKNVYIDAVLASETRTQHLPDKDGTFAMLSDIPSLTGFVPYTGAIADVELGDNDLYLAKLWLYDEPNGGHGSVHLTDGVFHVEDVDGHSMITFEDQFFTFSKTSSIRALLDLSDLSINRDYLFPDESGTLALTSDIPTITPAALTKTDDTNVTLTLGGTPATSLLQSVSLTLGWAGTLADSRISSSSNWNTAYSDRLKWDGGATGLVAATGRTSLGATTVGGNLFTLTNPSSITFIRVNADNSISTLDASSFRTAIGAGTSSTNGTVTSVAAITLGTSGTDLSSTVANGTTTPVITLNVPDASATARGVITIGAQTIAGAKTFSTAPILNSLSALSILATDASKNVQSLDTATYPSLTELTTLKGVTSPIQTQFNNLGFSQSGLTSYTGTITWAGTTAPSGTNNFSYNWTKIGNQVTLTITLVYGTAGTSNTSVAMTLPSGSPTPIKPTGLSGALDKLYIGTGKLTQNTTSALTNANETVLRSNSGNNGFEVVVSQTSVNARLVNATLQYFTA